MNEKKVLLQFIYESIGAQKAIATDKAVKAQANTPVTSTPWGLRGPGGRFVSADPQKSFGFAGGGSKPPIIGSQMDFGFGDEAKWGKPKKGFLDVTEAIDKNKKSLKDLGKTTQEVGINYGKLATRAMATIPIWLAIRSAYMAVIQTVQEGVKHIIDFDKALARAKSVLTGVTDVGGFMKGLAGEIRKLSIETGISASELAEAFYRFGSAGLDAETALAGMNVSAKTSIALMGDLTETSRMLADIYVLLGDSVTKFKTPQEKMNYLASTIAVLWKENTFELNEFTDSIKTFAATAANFNLTVEQMMALIAANSTLMQRAGTGGTQLSQVFIQLSKNSQKARDYLGITDNKVIGSWELFMRVVEKLNKEIQSGVPIMAEIEEIFKVRASKAVAGFANQFDLVVKQLQTANLSPDEKMKQFNEGFKTQIETIKDQLNIIGELKKQTFELFAIGVTGSADYVGSLKILADYMQNTLIPLIVMTSVFLRRLFEPPKKEDATKNMGKLLLFGPFAALMKGKPGRGSIAEESFDIISKYYEGVTAEIEKQKTNQKILGALKGESTAQSLQENKTLAQRMEMLDLLRVSGISEIEIQRRKIALISDINEKQKEELKLQKLINEEIIKQSETIGDLAMEYEKTRNPKLLRAMEIAKMSPESQASLYRNGGYEKRIIEEFPQILSEAGKTLVRQAAMSMAGISGPELPKEPEAPWRMRWTGKGWEKPLASTAPSLTPPVSPTPGGQQIGQQINYSGSMNFYSITPDAIEKLANMKPEEIIAYINQHPEAKQLIANIAANTNTRGEK